MKKKIIGSVFVVAFALVAGYNVYCSQKFVEMSDVALANVEALAVGETGHQYEVRYERSVEVLDEATQTYKKVTIIECEGQGSLAC